MTTTLVRTRPTTPLDLPPLVAMHERCSPATLHRRYHVPLAGVSARAVAGLLPPPDGWSIVAEVGERVVAHGCAGPVAPGVVEVGLLVEDAHQGTGIGARLTRDLAAEAVRRGFGAMLCLTQPGQDAVVRTVRSAGLGCAVVQRDGLVEVTVPLGVPGHALGRPA